MSQEHDEAAYQELLCANGHRRIIYSSGSLDMCDCGAPIAYSRVVDPTHDSGKRYPLEVAEPAETAVCNLGLTHVIREARYKIPAE